MPWYKPLIKPSVKLGRHYFWSNFYIPNRKFNRYDKGKFIESTIEILAARRNFPMDLVQKIKDRSWDRNHSQRRTCLRNMLDPRIGKYILDCAKEIKNKNLESWIE